MWVGIGLGLAALAGLVLLLLCLEKRRYNTRQRLRTIQLSMATGTGEFVGGFKLEQEQEPVQESRTSTKKASRRSRIIGEQEHNFFKAPPHETQTEEAGKKHREAFSAWKMKTAAAKANAESPQNVLMEEPVEEPLEQHTASTEPPEEPINVTKKERRRTFDFWKSGVVPPMDGASADK